MNGIGLQGLSRSNLTKSIRPAAILLAISVLCADLTAQQEKSSGAVEGQWILQEIALHATDLMGKVASAVQTSPTAARGSVEPTMGYFAFASGDLSPKSAIQPCSWQSVNPRRSAMSVTTMGRKTYRGIVRNEGNFSLQIRTVDALFYSFTKAELRNFEYESHPLMPDDCDTRLTQREIADLISYLMSASSGDKPKPKARDEE